MATPQMYRSVMVTSTDTGGVRIHTGNTDAICTHMRAQRGFMRVVKQETTVSSTTTVPDNAHGLTVPFETHVHTTRVTTFASNVPCNRSIPGLISTVGTYVHVLKSFGL